MLLSVEALSFHVCCGISRLLGSSGCVSPASSIDSSLKVRWDKHRFTDSLLCFMEPPRPQIRAAIETIFGVKAGNPFAWQGQRDKITWNMQLISRQVIKCNTLIPFARYTVAPECLDFDLQQPAGISELHISCVLC